MKEVEIDSPLFYYETNNFFSTTQLSEELFDSDNNPITKSYSYCVTLPLRKGNSGGGIFNENGLLVAIHIGVLSLYDGVKAEYNEKYHILAFGTPSYLIYEEIKDYL